MADDKGTMKKLLLLGVVIVVVVVIVLVAFLALGVIFFLITSPSVETTNNYEASQTITQPTNPIQPTNQNQTPSEPQEPVVQESLWGIIQRPLVEKICLEQAKVQAEDLAWAVNSCSCSESIGEEQKNYICSVSAIDGLHALDISCSKINDNCNINSEYGVFVYTFEELQYLAN